MVIRPLVRMGQGLSALMERDAAYFKRQGGQRYSRFREDIRLIVGGALAAAFVVSAFTGHIDVAYVNSAITLIAAVIGGVVAKYLLV
jgi:hypothetical protein